MASGAIFMARQPKRRHDSPLSAISWTPPGGSVLRSWTASCPFNRDHDQTLSSVNGRPRDFHISRRIFQRSETEFRIQAMSISRNEHETPQTLEVWVRGYSFY